MPGFRTTGNGSVKSATCWIYGSERHEGMYLYLGGDAAFDPVPRELRERFGSPRFVMTLELSAERPLARVDSAEVLRQLGENGYYLQMPPSETATRIAAAG
jgi:uncharacterized protein YcgL (UPF0745 family)